MAAPPSLQIDHLSAPDDPVWSLVVQRALDGGRPGRRTDGARLALAVEGGGMAGAVSAGMCVALESLGLVPSFDVVYGSSAGAINASYTAAGQALQRAWLYPHAANAGVIDPRRLLQGRPPFRLTAVRDAVLRAHPHRPDVLRGEPALRVTATRVEDKGLDVLTDFTSVDELCRAVWASCAIPILGGKIVELRGRRYVDGGLVESLPYGAALREGATHVLVLRARHAGYRIRSYPPWTARAIDRLLRHAPRTIPELVRERPARYNAEAAALESGALAGRVTQVAPAPEARATSHVESRPRRLVEAIELGVRTAYQAAAPHLARRHAGARQRDRRIAA